MFCERCGRPISDTAHFCSACGTRTGNSSENVQPPFPSTDSGPFPPDAPRKTNTTLLVLVGVGAVLLIGIVFIAIVVIIAVPSLLEARQAAQYKAAIGVLRNIAAAEVAYSSRVKNKGLYGTAKELASDECLDSRFAAAPVVIDGYRFSIESDGEHFKATAVPVKDDTRKGAYIDGSMIIRDMGGNPTEGE